MQAEEEIADNGMEELVEDSFFGWLLFFGVIGYATYNFLVEQTKDRVEGPLNAKEWLTLFGLMILIIGPSNRPAWTLIVNVPVCLFLVWLGLTANRKHKPQT